MDKHARLDNFGVASLALASFLLLAGWISTSAQLAAEHERQLAGQVVKLVDDGRMKVTVIGRAADADRQVNTAAASPAAAQAISGQATGLSRI